MVGREADRSGVVRDVVEPNGFRVVDQHAEDAEPLGQVADLGVHIFIDAFVDELDKFVVVPADTDRAVLRVDEFDRGVHDSSQGFIELEPRRDHQHGFDQAVQPIAAFDDLLDAVLDLHEQLAKAQLR